ncbi:MAG: dGTPase [Campylobacterota bacterium]
MIDYTKRITTHRQYYPIDDLDISIESDRGRIISSPAFRRLQKRTQVFPLELDAAVRSRLTHSLEVAQTSRFIAKKILQRIEDAGKYKLQGLQDAFVSIAEMTSMVHDIGNPPFGHFAEAVISDWSKNEALPLYERYLKQRGIKNNKLKTKLRADLSDFDGNAQSVRVITRLQRLNLSFSQIASVLKYTRGAYEDKPLQNEKLAYLRKKPGFYYSEEDIVHQVQNALGLRKWHRFAITYIMEAADDISYLTADLEDAVDKGLLNLDQVVGLITGRCEEISREYGLQHNELQKLVENFYQKVQKDDEPYRFNLFLTLLRARLINWLVEYVATSYLHNHEAVFAGSYDGPLLGAKPGSQEALAVKVLQDISIDNIYNHKKIQNMELQSFTIVKGLLECFKPLLEVDYEDMQKLIGGKKVAPLIVPRLFHRLPKKQRIVYQSSVAGAQKENRDKDDIIMLEWYFRMRLILDFISGMTDDYALSEYKTLTVSD